MDVSRSIYPACSAQEYNVEYRTHQTAGVAESWHGPVAFFTIFVWETLLSPITIPCFGQVLALRKEIDFVAEP